jgi:hypothetical protein
MRKFGPSRGEILFRLWASVAGLVLLAGALLLRGLPGGPAMFEIVAIAGAFFGGTLIWSLRILRKSRHDDDAPGV